MTLFEKEFRRFQDREDVIAVAPDASASKLVTYFSRALNLKSAIASKYRPRPEEAVVAEVSGGTMYALIKKLVEEKGIEEVYLGCFAQPVYGACLKAPGGFAQRLSPVRDIQSRAQAILEELKQVGEEEPWEGVRARLDGVLSELRNAILSVSSRFQ